MHSSGAQDVIRAAVAEDHIVNDRWRATVQLLRTPELPVPREQV